MIFLFLSLPAFADAIDCVSSYGVQRPVGGVIFKAPATLKAEGNSYRLDGLVVDVIEDPSLAAQRQDMIDRWLLDAKDRVEIYHKRRSAKDRYGRQASLLLISKDGVEADIGHSLQAFLVQNGLGRVDPAGLSDLCAERLLAYEDRARLSQAGIWSLKNYQTINAHDHHLSALVSTYQHVRGKVISVFRSEKGMSYLNFGHHWKTDFTIALGKKTRSQWEGDDKSLEDLRGSSIYVRGWIETQNGPLIRVTHPKQLSSDIGDTIE